MTPLQSLAQLEHVLFWHLLLNLLSWWCLALSLHATLYLLLDLYPWTMSFSKLRIVSTLTHSLLASVDLINSGAIFDQSSHERMKCSLSILLLAKTWPTIHFIVEPEAPFACSYRFISISCSCINLQYLSNWTSLFHSTFLSLASTQRTFSLHSLYVDFSLAYELSSWLIDTKLRQNQNIYISKCYMSALLQCFTILLRLILATFPIVV